MVEIIGWGVIGCGITDRRIIPQGIKPAINGFLVAVMDINPQVARQIGEKYDVPSFTIIENLLERDDVDVVCVATPNRYHYGQTIQALKAKKHVLVEKPMALTGDEAREMVELADEQGLILSVDYMMRYNPCNQKVCDLLPKIGQPVSVEMFFGCWYPCDDNNINGWRWNLWLSGGGALMDLVTHCIDLLRWWFGEIKTVSAQPVYAKRNRRVDETIAVVLSFDESPLIATIQASFMVPDGTPSRFLIRGTEGYIEGWGTLGQEPTGRLEYVLGIGQEVYDASQRKEGVEPETFTALGGQGLYWQISENVSAAIVAGGKPLVTGEDGLECALVCDAIKKSLEEQKTSFIDR